jgi:hypothetical protein
MTSFYNIYPKLSCQLVQSFKNLLHASKVGSQDGGMYRCERLSPTQNGRRHTFSPSYHNNVLKMSLQLPDYWNRTSIVFPLTTAPTSGCPQSSVGAKSSTRSSLSPFASRGVLAEHTAPELGMPNFTLSRLAAQANWAGRKASDAGYHRTVLVSNEISMMPMMKTPSSSWDAVIEERNSRG